MSASPSAFDASALSAKYTVLDALPEKLYQATLTSSSGELLPRVEAVLAWRESLLRGAAPDPLPRGWPTPEMGTLFAGLLASTHLLRFTRGEAEIVDAVLLDFLTLADRAGTWERELFEETFRGLLDAAKLRREQEARARKERKGARGPVDETNVPMLRRDAEEAAREKAKALVAQAFTSGWGPRTAAWVAIEEMFGPLSNLLGLGWDLSRSVLRSTGWLAAEKLRALLERLPDLKRVIEALGRMSVPPDPKAKSLLEEIVGPLVRPLETKVPVRSPQIPVEMRGVERSGEIGRMLPSEAALLTHPLLRFVWHARRAERALLTYEAEGIDFRTVLVERETDGPGVREKPADEKGPMILCVDTSGSMAGAPETVAKAIALEALRVASAEKRRLFVYLFSGPGDIEERELAVSKQGISGLLDFLASSFLGGTDVAGPLRKAIQKVEENDWRNADVLLISDGEFPEDAALFASVAGAREKRQIRVQGLLVASHASAAMERICEPLHRFSEWQKLIEGAR